MAGIMWFFVIVGAVGGFFMAGPIGILGGAFIGLICGGFIAMISKFLGR